MFWLLSDNTFQEQKGIQQEKSSVKILEFTHMKFILFLSVNLRIIKGRKYKFLDDLVWLFAHMNRSYF